MTIQGAWCAETAVDPREWTPERPATGQCAVTALLVQELLGGRILRVEMSDGGSHYWNESHDWYLLDLTASQFVDGQHPVGFNQERTREALLTNNDTRRRYLLLRERFLAQFVAAS